MERTFSQRILTNEFNRASIDFSKLSDAMSGGAEILRTYYYNCPPYQSNPPTDEEKDRYNAARRFHNALEMLPRFEVRLGRLEFRGHYPDGGPIFEQKRVDILLGVDLVHLAVKGHIRQAVLLAGDSDFIPAVAVAKSEGIPIQLFHGNNCHSDLQREVDERVKLDQQFIDAILRT